MNKRVLIGLLFLLPFLAGGCSDGPTNSIDGKNQQVSEKKQFVWEAMNLWYLWQQEVPELGDNYFETKQAYHQYLKGFKNAKALFKALKYEKDRFSWFIKNYKKQQKAFKGISKSFGFSFGLIQIKNSSQVFGYVQYVLPKSPAKKAGLKRGDLFIGVNGSTLTENNYQDLLNSDHYELTMADIKKNTISKTGKTISMDAVQLHKNPVYMVKVIDTGSIKVGYLVLNAFRANYHKEMNQAFGKLKQKGIDELVLDLRYNGGGAGITAALLASMISGIDSTHVFVKYKYNKKLSGLNEKVHFKNELPIDGNMKNEGDAMMNKLSLDRLYVLTGFGTASASEMVINGLKPYLGDGNIVLIGEQTVGKDVASYTLYDIPAPYLKKEDMNPDHKIALQPIVAQFFNANGQNYPNGFKPDYKVLETRYLEDLPPLGSKNEPLLAKALALITGQPQMARAQKPQIHREIIADSRDLQPFGKGVHLMPELTEKLPKSGQMSD